MEKISSEIPPDRAAFLENLVKTKTIDYLSRRTQIANEWHSESIFYSLTKQELDFVQDICLLLAQTIDKNYLVETSTKESLSYEQVGE